MNEELSVWERLERKDPKQIAIICRACLRT
jgi:hypothetical protein